VKKSLIHDYKYDPAFSRHILEPELPFEVRGGMLHKDGKLCVPIWKLPQTLMHDAHGRIVAGHLGIEKTIASIRKRFEWGGMSKDVAEYVRSCDRCQRNKPAPSNPIGFLQSLEVPGRNWEHVTIEFIMDLPKSKAGHDAILVAVDKLSKAMTLIPTKSTVSAQQFAQLFLKDVYRLHGLPRKIISDRDVRFTGKFWQELHRLVQTKLAMSSSFHSQTDGQTERANRTLEEMLRYYVGYRQDDWCDKLWYLEFSYNSAKNKTTGQTPFLLNYGQQPLEFSDLLLTRQTNTVPSASDFVAHMQELAKAAGASIEQKNKATAEYQNAKRKDYEFGVGDKVLLSTRYLKPPEDKERRKKLAAKFAGPYEIIQVVSQVAFKLSLPPGTNAHPVFHAGLLKPYFPDATGHRIPESPEPVVVNGQIEYLVETILDTRMVRNKTQYLSSGRGTLSTNRLGNPKKMCKGLRQSRTFKLEGNSLEMGRSVGK
jgi:Integrase zinc binding domain